MSVNKTTVKFYKKRYTEKNKIVFKHGDFQVIRKWLITGSFTNSFFLNESFDKSEIPLLRKIILHSPSRIEQIIDETYDNRLNKSTFIYTLVLLSNGPFKAKKIFKANFDKIINSPSDLYKFMELCKKERGFGKIIHESINGWFKHQDIHKLEDMFLKERHGSNWKIQDIMRLMKPKPTDKKEQLLFKWFAKDGIDEADALEYKESFPRILAYETMRKNKASEEEVIDYIKKFRFTNQMIPSNINRTEKIIYCLLTPDEDEPPIGKLIDTYSHASSYLHRLDTLKNDLFLYFSKRKKFILLNVITLLTIYSKLQKETMYGQDMEFLDLSEELLLDRIRKTYNTSINIVDTGPHMFSDEIKSLQTSPAIASSVMIGMSKNVFDLDGNKFHRTEPRKILNAEGYVRDKRAPKYKRIFDSIKDIESNVVFVWTNDRTFPKENFNREFTKWKLNNSKQMKLVFINLVDNKQQTKYKFKEIYGLSKKTLKLLKYIKEGMV